ncbi:MAG: hypothetical protein KME67_19320 [Candidatus Thiodiazotropha sp. (ex Codakia orbicularis)]|nr:hypothetical protein [Candidatus Thiodiazotropha sp. (ex Codakia orbicularis)]
MKVKLNGIITTEELRQLLYQAVSEMEDVGITQVRGCNLYFTPVDGSGHSYKPRKHGISISEIKVDGPYRCAADDMGV